MHAKEVRAQEIAPADKIIPTDVRAPRHDGDQKGSGGYLRRMGKSYLASGWTLPHQRGLNSSSRELLYSRPSPLLESMGKSRGFSGADRGCEDWLDVGRTLVEARRTIKQNSGRKLKL